MAKSNDKSPPHLHARPRLPVYPMGDWISSSCETRPIGTFLMRRMKFTDHQNGRQTFLLLQNLAYRSNLSFSRQDWTLASTRRGGRRRRHSRPFSTISPIQFAPTRPWPYWLLVTTRQAQIPIECREPPNLTFSFNLSSSPFMTNPPLATSTDSKYFD